MPRGLSERAHVKVLDAATTLFSERGIDATSMDAIAAASRVSKATIYKHWADKDALCMEALVHLHELDDGPPEIDSGDLKADIAAFLLHEPNAKKAGVRERLMPHLIAYSARNQEFGRAWRARILERAREGLKGLVRRGVNRGIFSTLIDEDLAVLLLLGPMLFSHIFGGRVDRKWLAHGTVESFWKAHARPHAARVPAPGSAAKPKKRS
ncbi:MAG TPA: TetR/AcrR family transcriptional regulator [Dongiaceae bacterium]|nr:TetR/AcrR family transcriptional regulator [Dongiaceae bacterium]